MKKYSATISLLIACALSSFANDNSPYINKVYEYAPAPGQFINTAISYYEEGDFYSDVLQKVNTALVGKKNGLVTLGAYGGYIVIGFDHTIANVAGGYDFKIYGNASSTGSEPGIVMVSADANGDGLPNDEWYEIAGSEFGNKSIYYDYRITYHRPNPDNGDVRWTDNNGSEGYVHRVPAHTQATYYPEWVEGETLVFEGTRLPGNAVNRGTDDVPYWSLEAYEWGYADNQPNNSDYSNFKIEWAIKKDHTPANLKGIDFIKVYTGVAQECGSLGETSTEVSGIEDLHPDAPIGIEDAEASGFAIYPTLFNEHFFALSPVEAVVTVYNLLGNRVLRQSISMGNNEIATPHLQNGYYTICIESAGKTVVFKAVKR